MATKGQKSPLTRLGKAIDAQIKRGIGQAWVEDNSKRLISIRTLQRWRKWAEAPDARFRLDGSKLSKKTKR